MRISAVVTLTLAILGAGCGGYDDGDLDGVSSTAESLTLIPGPTPPPHIELCGNGTCQAWLGETCSTCPQDCGDCCGNHQLDPGETCDNSSFNLDHRCPTSCGTCEELVDAGTCQARCVAVTPCCGNGICEVSLGEDSGSCSAECYCGNGIVDSNEACDGDCPTSCGDFQVLVGDPDLCTAYCTIDDGQDPDPEDPDGPKPGGPIPPVGK